MFLALGISVVLLLAWVWRPKVVRVERIELGVLHKELHDIELRLMREEDEIRIMTRQDINIDSLRHRMLEGKAPKKKMLELVAPVWARKAAGGK